MEKKNIVFIYNGHISNYPPFLSLLDYLIETSNYELTVIASEYESSTQKVYEEQGVKIISLYHLEPKRGLLSRIRNKIKKEFFLFFKFEKLLRSVKCDILWIIGERTTVALGKKLLNKKFIQTVYELNDIRPKMLKQMAPATKAAYVNVACEYNRSQIMRAWFNLKDTPVVLPNKPYFHPRRRNIECQYSKLLEGKKIILYQGHIIEERNLDGICEASLRLKDYCLVLMGGGSSYREFLKEKYPSVLFIDHVLPPHHLDITSYASIGVVTYSPTTLNNIYCAPNKIWEYGGFGIPMLANDIPGLHYTVEDSGAGLCIDMDDPDEIVDAVNTIDRKYDLYSKKAQEMYNSVDLGAIINNIIKKYNE